MDKTIIILSWMTLTSAWLRISDDLVYSPSAAEIVVEIKPTNRSKRSIKDTYTEPRTLDLAFQIEGSPVNLHLERNDGVNTNLPVTVFENGNLRKRSLQDEEVTTFYQDKNTGSSFAVQRIDDTNINMIGRFKGQYNWYTIQSKDTDSATLDPGYHKFDIRTEKIVLIANDADFIDETINDTNTSTEHVSDHRRKRAAGSYNVELLIVSDYSVYKYWYDLSRKSSDAEKVEDAYKSIRQYYAFVINGMDAAYKNIQTSAYTISVVFGGLIVAKTETDSTWTEGIKNTTKERVSIDSDNSLERFREWIKQKPEPLPEMDHSMLFTKYDLTRNGSSNNIGLAYVGAICGPSSQSIIEDQFDFGIITTTAHELGHSLSAEHDGKGNVCDGEDGFVMAAVSSIHKGVTATNPWKFSSCSTNYFTTKLDSLDAKEANCLREQGPKYDPTALTPFNNQFPGEMYDADEQCRHIHGRRSFFCRDRYHGNFTSICNGMMCADPNNRTYCFNHIPGDGTQCGDKKMCLAGVCKINERAKPGNEKCLYGDKIGGVFRNGWTCKQMYKAAPRNCHLVEHECCKTCQPLFALNGISNPDEFCKRLLGNSSYFCRDRYNGNYTSICDRLWCKDPTRNSHCIDYIAGDGTLCGDKKVCVSSACKSDINAPTADENCLYGDNIGKVFSNGWTCQQMYKTAPQDCQYAERECCKTCKPHSALRNITDPDQLCKGIVGKSSFLCRGIYKGNYSSICAHLWCSNPSNPENCVSIQANDRTLCDTKKWCIAGVCKSDIDAPVADSDCLYGDYVEPVYTNGETCSIAYRNNPNVCNYHPERCCKTCSPKTTGVQKATTFPSTQSTQKTIINTHMGTHFQTTFQFTKSIFTTTKPTKIKSTTSVIRSTRLPTSKATNRPTTDIMTSLQPLPTTLTNLTSNVLTRTDNRYSPELSTLTSTEETMSSKSLITYLFTRYLSTNFITSSKATTTTVTERQRLTVESSHRIKTSINSFGTTQSTSKFVMTTKSSRPDTPSVESTTTGSTHFTYSRTDGTSASSDSLEATPMIVTHRQGLTEKSSDGLRTSSNSFPTTTLRTKFVLIVNPSRSYTSPDQPTTSGSTTPFTNPSDDGMSTSNDSLGNMILIPIFAVVGGMVVLVVVTITACIACRRKQLKSEVKL